MERTQVIIDDNKRAITIRTATGTFTQNGVSKPIIDYITTLQEENEKLKSIIKEVREYIKEHTENIDRGRYYEDYIETYPILEILDKENIW